MISNKQDWPILEKDYPEYCDSLKKFSSACYGAIGASIFVEEVKSDKISIHEACSKGQKENRWHCFKLMLQTYVYETGEKANAQKQCFLVNDNEIKKRCSDFVSKL